MQNYSSTQIANFNSIAALLMILLSKMGFNTSIQDITFGLGLIWGIGATAYNYYRRYKRGDLSPLGVRLK